MDVEYEIAETLVPETKVCAHCQLEKALAHFNSNGRGRVRTECRICQSAQHNRWKEAKDRDPSMGTSSNDALYIMRISKLPGIVKVGHSKNVTERAYQLSQSQPFVVTVEHAYDKYGFLESAIHRKLIPYRVMDATGREWFHANANQVNAIILGAIAEYELMSSQYTTDVQNTET